MGFKTGFLVGAGVGYVLGARAGRQRYEEIKQLFGQVSESPKVQRAVERTQEVAGERGKRALEAVQSGVEKAGSAVKERLGKEGDDSGETTDPWRGNDVPTSADGPLP